MLKWHALQDFDAGCQLAWQMLAAPNPLTERQRFNQRHKVERYDQGHKSDDVENAVKKLHVSSDALLKSTVTVM